MTTILNGTALGADGSTAEVTIEYSGPVVTPPPTGPLIPDGANWVEADGKGWPLAAVDPGERNAYPGERGANELIVYTKGLRTETNEYGWEVQFLADGTVVSAGQANATLVPSGGGVLSGHDVDVPVSAADFVKSLKVGAKLVFKKVAVPPPTPPPAMDGPFPLWVVSGYWQQYQGPALDVVLREAPGYNVAWAAFATTTDGAQGLTFNPRTFSAYSGSNGEALFKDHVAAWHAVGKVVGLSFGGGVKAAAATVLKTDAHAAKVYDRMAPIIEKYGFRAVDCDMENGPAGFTTLGLAGLFRRLFTTFGKDFGLAATPRPYEDFYYDTLGELYDAGLLDIVQHQFYDAPEYRDAAFVKTEIPKKVENARRRGIPVECQVAGTIVWPGYNLGWNTTEAYLAAMREVPKLRGAMHWEFSLDKKTGWSFASKMAAASPVVK